MSKIMYDDADDTIQETLGDSDEETEAEADDEEYEPTWAEKMYWESRREEETDEDIIERLEEKIAPCGKCGGNMSITRAKHTGIRRSCDECGFAYWVGYEKEKVLEVQELLAE